MRGPKTQETDRAKHGRVSALDTIRKQGKDVQLREKRFRNYSTDPSSASTSTSINNNFTHISPTTPSSSNQAPNKTLDHIHEMVLGIQSQNLQTQTDCTTQFRRLLSIEKNPPIQQVIDVGVVPIFINFLTRDDAPGLQFEAAWALTNIASGTSDHTKVVISAGGVPHFCRLLTSTNDDVREQAVWALGNIAGDSPTCRDQVLNVNAMAPLLSQLHTDSKLSMLRNATWTLSNFCRGKPQPDFTLVQPCLPVLSSLIWSQDEEVLTDACWALSYLSDGNNDKIQSVIHSGVCKRLVDILAHPSASVQTPALRTVGNIVTGDDTQTQMILNCNVLPSLRALLASPKKGIRKEACWTISNITAGNHTQIQGVLDSNIMDPLIDLLRHAEFDIKKEAAWAVSNATSGGTHEQIIRLVEMGCIGPLCELLTVVDTKIITVALEGLENILKVGEDPKYKTHGTNKMATMVDEAGGRENIEKLTDHENTEIYDKCHKMYDAYFDEDGEEGGGEDFEIMPQTNEQGQFNFGAQQGGGFNF